MVIASSLFDLTRRLRSLIQPGVTCRVQSGTHLILQIQRFHHVDALFSVLSCIVSVPFYTGFLPLLFWSGHSKLARQMTLLMVFCDYIGNSIKDMISSPRLSCPPVRRLTTTKDEKENAMEYGLPPSSNALNTVCLSGYLLHYVIARGLEGDSTKVFIGFTLVFILVLLIGVGRIYFGMHSVIDVLAGIGLGLVLSFWLTVHEFINDFIISGQNVASFCSVLSCLVCFAYPIPEFPTPSFEYHAAFSGVTFGIISGIQLT